MSQKKLLVASTALVLSTASLPALAVNDYTTMLSAVNTEVPAVVAAILAIGATMITLKVAMVGIRWIKRAIA